VRAFLLAAAVLVASPVLADSFKAPALKQGSPVSIQGYGSQNTSCLEWTNGCVLCSNGADGHARCSTPGIACQPAGITCKRKR
jgi:hypothetical protein